MVLDPRLVVTYGNESFMYVVCPDEKVRKLTQVYRKLVSPTTITLNYLVCGIRLYNQLLKGWRDNTTGKFVPNTNNAGFSFLVDMGALGPEWLAAAKTDEELQRLALRARALKHGVADCVRPAWEGEGSGIAEDTWVAHMMKYWTHKLTDAGGAVVHGTETDFLGFQPSADCPNRTLWKP